jgi:hypothetical protein
MVLGFFSNNQMISAGRYLHWLQQHRALQVSVGEPAFTTLADSLRLPPLLVHLVPPPLLTNLTHICNTRRQQLASLHH